MRGNNSKQSKTSNLRLVLNLITTARPISRVEIARRTALTKQTISNLTDELAGAGLIHETGIRREGVGKPSKMLDLNPEGAYTVGLRVKARSIEAGLYNIAGEAVDVRQFPFNEQDPDVLVETLAQIVDTCLQGAPAERERVLGVGLVMPPPQSFSRDPRKAGQLGNLTDQHVQQVRAQLIERIRLPVVSENVAAAVSASEMLYGSARDLRSFVYIHLGESLEAGIVFNRQLFGGYNGISGRLGHVIVDQHGGQCRCGNHGCLDLYASLGSLSKALGRKIKPGQDWWEILADPEKHKAVLDAWFQQMSEPMRIAFNMVENLVNPQTVILGGDIPDWFIDQFIRRLRPFIPSVSQYGEREIPRFIRAPKMENMALLGAATLPIYSAISSEGARAVDIDALGSVTELQELVYA
ncbi:ROK family transcriptional regulator [Microbulbifer sp. HZ11]|uniref:ROK family transcriptional regulator n=1 Tax=Microbulbifer sp. HZ11 TaxID=1453501 RepID=UPI0005B799B4|nr:ROK family transcriptional regulator [Microbulbifer sp. HZ11]